jgi:5-formyltetrahydrofolate cyclo-ligase
MRNRVLHLGLQCLLYMSREEEEPAEELIRQARTQGKRLLSAIVRAKFVDEYCRKTLPGQARVIASYVPENESRTVAGCEGIGADSRTALGPPCEN